jgi:hypothetical protein
LGGASGLNLLTKILLFIHHFADCYPAANKGVRVKKGLVGKVTEGAEDVLKGAGKELKKLFGK